MSEVRVNKISPRSGTTVTLGDNGDTITIPSGVTLDASSGGLAGTLTTAAQPNITSLGTITSFTSTGIDDNATSTAITINSSEFIGVGTASPQRLLHLQGNDGASGTTSGNSDTQIFIDNAGTNGAIIELGSATVGKGTIQFSDADASNRGSIGYAHTTDHMNFNTASSERMRIDSSGNVGIGTTSPTYKLTVQDSADNQDLIRLNHPSAATAGAMLGFTTDGTTDNNVFTLGVEYSAVDYDVINIQRSTQNVGIGETAPLGKLHVKTADTGATSVSSNANELVIENTGNVGITLQSDNSGTGNLYFGDVANGSIGRVSYDHSSNFMSFNTNATERMRIASNGRQTYNGSSTASGHGNFVGEVGASYNALAFEHTNGGGIVGTVRTTASSTAYNTSSDYRLKENVNYDFDATTRLKQLKPARFNFIVDADKTVDGFLAHEVSSVVPEAISGEKDETKTKEKVVVNANGKVIAENIEQADWETGKIADEEGNTKYPTDSTWQATKVVPVYQGIDQSKLVPLLVKTIQELEARITTLENA
jgi:hypothetical protein